MIAKAKKDGWLGEVLVARYYRDAGYQLLDANFRTSVGEVDIIVYQGDTLVFCEVKTRHPSATLSPKEAVDEYKQKRMVAAAAIYQKIIGYEGKIRLDVAEVNLCAPLGKQVHIIEQAFDVN